MRRGRAATLVPEWIVDATLTIVTADSIFTVCGESKAKAAWSHAHQQQKSSDAAC
jgi:hypothetical protein